MMNDSAVPRSHANQRSTTPMTTVASQTCTPLRTANGRTRGVGATSQPTARPMRNGAATPRIEAMPLPSSCELRPRTTNSEHGRDVGRDGDESLLHVVASLVDLHGDDRVVVGHPALWFAMRRTAREQDVALRPVHLQRAGRQAHELGPAR